jgi:uncharacterized protein
MEYDVIIVGAGPAGFFAAYEFAKNKSPLKVLLIDQGNLIENRKKSEVMTGFGGAGTFSDGKLHFTPVLSHERMLHLYTENEYLGFLDYVQGILMEFGVPNDFYPKDLEKTTQLVEQAEINNIKLYVRKIIHVGTDRLPKIMKTFEDYLSKNGVTMMPCTEVVDLIVQNNIVKGVKTSKGETLLADKVICAPGRYNAKWMQEIAIKYKIGEAYDKIEVGVRVEFPASLLQKHAEQMYEAVFSMRTPTYDDLARTFCPCPRGHVAIENYEGFVCVNGYSNSSHDSNNSNFALVTEIKLTEPLENTRAYANFIAQGATLLGGGKPIIQRLKDLKLGRRSTPKRIARAHIIPTLKEAVPGDIGMALPYRTVKNILEGIEMLDKVLPGLNGDSTFLYAPEVKFRSSKIATTKNLETSVKGLYVAGDAAGLSGNIVGAAITGVIAARGVMNSGAGSKS